MVAHDRRLAHVCPYLDHNVLFNHAFDVPENIIGKHDHNSDMEIGISVTSYFSDTSFMMGSL